MERVRTRKELAYELGMHPRTLNRWLKRHKIDLESGLVSPCAQELIRKKLQESQQ